MTTLAVTADGTVTVATARRVARDAALVFVPPDKPERAAALRRLADKEVAQLTSEVLPTCL